MLAAPWFLAVVGFVINMVCTVVMLNAAVSKLPKPDFTPVPDPVEVAATEAKAAEVAAPPPQLWSFKTNAVDELITELKKEREAIIEEQKDSGCNVLAGDGRTSGGREGEGRDSPAQKRT
jgi:hypothetical protein